MANAIPVALGVALFVIGIFGFVGSIPGLSVAAGAAPSGAVFNYTFTQANYTAVIKDHSFLPAVGANATSPGTGKVVNVSFLHIVFSWGDSTPPVNKTIGFSAVHVYTAFVGTYDLDEQLFWWECDHPTVGTNFCGLHDSEAGASVVALGGCTTNCTSAPEPTPKGLTFDLIIGTLLFGGIGLILAGVATSPIPPRVVLVAVLASIGGFAGWVVGGVGPI